jgi:pimeloyl-ACP methyl ester carboxylesterase
LRFPVYRRAFETLEQGVPSLRKKVVLPDAGHWIQQERPVDVNRLIIEFLKRPLSRRSIHP